MCVFVILYKKQTFKYLGITGALKQLISSNSIPFELTYGLLQQKQGHYYVMQQVLRQSIKLSYQMTKSCNESVGHFKTCMTTRMPLTYFD